MTYKDQKVFDVGKRAFRPGIDPSTGNPFASFTGISARGYLWLAGWCAAQAASRRTPRKDGGR